MTLARRVRYRLEPVGDRPRDIGQYGLRVSGSSVLQDRASGPGRSDDLLGRITEPDVSLDALFAQLDMRLNCSRPARVPNTYPTAAPRLIHIHFMRFAPFAGDVVDRDIPSNATY